MSQNAMDFVLALLRVDPGTRLTTEQALQHPWLTDAVEEAEEGENELGAAMVITGREQGGAGHSCRPFALGVYRPRRLLSCTDGRLLCSFAYRGGFM